MRREAILVAIALGTFGCKKPAPPSDEIQKRQALARALLADAGMTGVAVSDRPDIRFEWGFSGIQYDPPFDLHGKPFRWLAQRSYIRLQSHGNRPMTFN